MNDFGNTFQSLLFLKQYNTNIHQAPETGNIFFNFSMDFFFNSSMNPLFIFIFWSLFFTLVLLLCIFIKKRKFESERYDLNKAELKSMFKKFIFFDFSFRLVLIFLATYLFMFFTKINNFLIDITSIVFYTSIAFAIISFMPIFLNEKISKNGLKSFLKKEFYISVLAIALLFLITGIFISYHPQGVQALFISSIIFFLTGFEIYGICLIFSVLSFDSYYFHTYHIFKEIALLKNKSDSIPTYLECSVENTRKHGIKNAFRLIYTDHKLTDYFFAIFDKLSLEKRLNIAETIHKTLFEKKENEEYRNFISNIVIDLYTRIFNSFNKKSSKKEYESAFEFLLRILEEISDTAERDLKNVLNFLTENILKSFLENKLLYSENNFFSNFLAYLKNNEKTITPQNINNYYYFIAYMTIADEISTFNIKKLDSYIDKKTILKSIININYFTDLFIRRMYPDQAKRKIINEKYREIKKYIKNTFTYYINGYIELCSNTRTDEAKEYYRKLIMASINSSMALDNDLYLKCDYVKISIWNEILNSTDLNVYFPNRILQFILSKKEVSDENSLKELFIIILGRSEYFSEFCKYGSLFFTQINSEEFYDLWEIYKKELSPTKAIRELIKSSRLNDSNSIKLFEEILKKIEFIYE